MPIKDKDKYNAYMRKYNKRNIFTLKQIIEAFLKTFHGQGEMWFGNDPNEDLNELACSSTETREHWSDFLANLRGETIQYPNFDDPLCLRHNPTKEVKTK